MEEHVAVAATPRAESMFLSFLAMFASIYLVGYFIVFRGWGPRRRAEAASCFTSLFHVTPAALLALRGPRRAVPPPRGRRQPPRAPGGA